MENFGENRKRILYFVMTVAVIAVLMGMINCGLNKQMKIGGEEKSDRVVYKYHIALIGSRASGEFWESVYQGAKKQGEKQNIYVENFGENYPESYSIEDLMYMAITAKVDGIIVEADKEESMDKLINQAADEGIPVMTICTDALNSKRISFVSANDYALGEKYGNQVLEEVEERLEEGSGEEAVRVTVLTNSGNRKTVPNLIYSGINETLESAAGRKLVTVQIDSNEKFGNETLEPAAGGSELVTAQIGGSEKFSSEERVRNLILSQKYPEILVCLSEEDTISAYQSVVDYNMVGKVTIIGYYSSSRILEGIQKGIIKSAVVVNAEEMGATAADGMYSYFCKNYVSEYLPVSAELITRENVDEYIEEEEEGEGAYE